MNSEVRQHWIQEQSPNGGWFDSVGLPTTEAEARRQFDSWKRSFPDRKVRLVVRRDEEVAS